MNKLERIGLERAQSFIREARIKLSEEEEGRQEHLRIFTDREVRNAQEMIDALIQNDKQLKNEKD